MATDNTPATPSTMAQWATRSGRFSRVVDSVGDWDVPTPCSQWSARDLVDHVVTTEREFLARVGLDLGPDPAGDDPAARWRTHLAAVDAALADPQVPDQPYDSAFGPSTVGATMNDFYGWDLAIHGWDLAKASGVAYDLGDAEAGELEATSRTWGPALYSEGICSEPAPVPRDASPVDRLVAALGRDPRWSPRTA